MDNSNSNGVDVNNEILPESLHSPADSDIAQLHGSIICNKIEGNLTNDILFSVHPQVVGPVFITHDPAYPEKLKTSISLVNNMITDTTRLVILKLSDYSYSAAEEIKQTIQSNQQIYNRDPLIIFDRIDSENSGITDILSNIPVTKVSEQPSKDGTILKFEFQGNYDSLEILWDKELKEILEKVLENEESVFTQSTDTALNRILINLLKGLSPEEINNLVILNDQDMKIGVQLNKKPEVVYDELKLDRTYSCFTKDAWFDFGRNFSKQGLILYPDNMFQKDENYYIDIQKIRENPKIFNKFDDEVWEVILKHRVVKPGNCLFAFGIPTGDRVASLSQTEFNIIKNDYLKKAKTITIYQEMVLKPAKSFIDTIKKLHVTVKENIKLADLTSFFKQDYRVIVLFTHFIGKENKTYDTSGCNGVELGNRFISFKELAAVVPSKYSNRFELCIFDTGLTEENLRIAHPKCNLRYLNGEVKPFVWLNFYQQLFKRFNKRNLSYIDTVRETYKYFPKMKRRSKKTKQGGDLVINHFTEFI